MTADAITSNLCDDDVELLAGLPRHLHRDNGVPDATTAAARVRAAEEIARVLDADLQPQGLRISPLGPAWSTDIDCHVSRPPDPARLRRAGWIHVSRLVATVGYRGTDRWAVLSGDEVLGSADLHTRPPPDPVGQILARCRRRGEVRLREVLELRSLLRSGAGLPTRDPVVVTAAGIEAALPGRAALGAWYDGRERACPARLPTPHPRIRAMRRRLGRLRAPTRRRVVVALGGVDGAGKSTVARLLVENLERAGVPCGSVWARPGMNIGWLERLALSLKRTSHASLEPGVRTVARGEAVAPRSRRGVVGWAWSSLVTVSYLVDTWRQHLGARGVVVYDRHLVDALVTLDFVYGGVNLDLQRRLVRAAVPQASWTFFLEVSAEVATGRKPDDVFGAHAVGRQLELYGERLQEIGSVVVLDGHRDPRTTASRILSLVAADPGRRSGG